MDNKEKQEQEPQVIFLKFADSAVPVFKEKKNKEWIEYGEKNNYPEYLLGLYNKSAKHNAIINGKALYEFGNGFENGDFSVNNDSDTLNEATQKMIRDRKIFGGFRLEIIWGFNRKISQIYHCDYTTLRKAKDGGFLFKECWEDKYDRVKPVFIPEFDPSNPVGSQIFEFNDYRPGIRFYPLPEYLGCLNYIETDIEISKFYLSSIKNGMMPSKMIQFYEGGNVTDEKKGKIEKRWQEKFTGSENAGKFILVFNTSKDKQVTVDDLSASELDKHFQELNKTTQQEIYAGHGITSPMLFGIKTEGQLGGNTEMKTAYSIFQNTYSKPKAKDISKVITGLMAYSNHPAQYELKPTDPIGLNIDIATVLDKLPTEFILETVGVPEELWSKAPAGAEVIPAQQASVNDNIKNLTAKQKQGIYRIVRDYNNPDHPTTWDQAALMLKSGYGLTDEEVKVFIGDKPGEFAAFSDDEIISVFDEYGDSKTDYEILQTRKQIFHSDEEEEVYKQAFAVYDVTETENRIIELIKKDPLITPDVIADTINQSKKYVESKLKSLIKKGYIEQSEETSGSDTVIKRTVPEKVTAPPSRGTPPTQISVKYSYEGPQDSRNRPFCAKMMKLNRLYSRAEIELISERLGYSVFDRRGGFWNDNGTIKPYCRHSWKNNLVVKKGGNNV